mgnify:CR=1 FL=1
MWHKVACSLYYILFYINNIISKECLNLKLTDDTEAERYRKILLQQADQIELLKKQLKQETEEKYGYIKRIKELLDE